MATLIHMPKRKHAIRPHIGPKVLAAVAAASLLAGLLLGVAAAHHLDTPAAAQPNGVAAQSDEREGVSQPSPLDRREEWRVPAQYQD